MVKTKVKCPYCAYTSTDIVYIKVHILVFHRCPDCNKYAPTYALPKGFKCKTCQNRRFVP